MERKKASVCAAHDLPACTAIAGELRRRVLASHHSIYMRPTIIAGAVILSALPLLIGGLAGAMVGYWRAIGHRMPGASRWDVVRRARWIGSNAKAAALVQPAGQRSLRWATHSMRVAMAGVGVFVLGAVIAAMVS